VINHTQKLKYILKHLRENHREWDIKSKYGFVYCITVFDGRSTRVVFRRADLLVDWRYVTNNLDRALDKLRYGVPR
jgi:hypothetical protein